MIVLSMITKNSYRELGDKFVETLRRSLQVPYRAIILVDDGEDETAEVVKRFAEEHGKEVVVTRSRLYGYHRATRATARQTAIDVFLENFSDEWLMFLDDDAWLNPGWWEDVRRFLGEPRVGEIWGVNWSAEGSPEDERRRLLEARGVRYEDFLIRMFEERGGTHDTLYRRAAIEGVRIPPCLHVYEDAFLHYYVVCRGWEYRISRVGVTHVNPGARGGPGDPPKPIMRFVLLAGIEKGYTGSLLRDLPTIMRPVGGFLLNLVGGVRGLGPRRGLEVALRYLRSKLRYRWLLYRTARELRRLLGRVRVDRCELVAGGLSGRLSELLCS